MLKKVVTSIKEESPSLISIHQTIPVTTAANI